MDLASMDALDPGVVTIPYRLLTEVAAAIVAGGADERDQDAPVPSGPDDTGAGTGGGHRA
jgi:hypothetical protein